VIETAHGTRVNGEALPAASSCTVKQDDTVQMGASTRSYKVDWVSVSAMDQQASEVSASVLERSLPNGSKASFRYKLGNIQVLLPFTSIKSRNVATMVYSDCPISLLSQ